MAQTTISGCSGSVTIAGRGGRIAAFSADLIHEVYDSTSFSDAPYRTNVGGLKHIQGTASGFLTYGTTSDTPNFNALTCGDAGESVTLTAITGCNYSFTANISRIRLDARVDDVQKISFEFQSTGPIEESWLVS